MELSILGYGKMEKLMEKANINSMTGSYYFLFSSYIEGTVIYSIYFSGLPMNLMVKEFIWISMNLIEENGLIICFMVKGNSDIMMAVFIQVSKS